MTRRLYSDEPGDAGAYREDFDRTYTRIARVYDIAVKALPIWKTWLERAVSHIKGRRVLEVSFGTGYLMTRYAGRFDVHGVELNARMLSVAMKNLRRLQLHAHLLRGTVDELPYEDGCFGTVVNTMAFSGYADGNRAMAELKRVLASDGRLVLIDINYPANGTWAGMKLTRCWQVAGDIIRDMDQLLPAHGFDYEDIEIGGFGSVHMYICHKTSRGQHDDQE